MPSFFQAICIVAQPNQLRSLFPWGITHNKLTRWNLVSDTFSKPAFCGFEQPSSCEPKIQNSIQGKTCICGPLPLRSEHIDRVAFIRICWREMRRVRACKMLNSSQKFWFESKASMNRVNSSQIWVITNPWIPIGYSKKNPPQIIKQETLFAGYEHKPKSQIRT